jgi:hypothetical protein
VKAVPCNEVQETFCNITKGEVVKYSQQVSFVNLRDIMPEKARIFVLL